MEALTAPLIDPVIADKGNNMFQNVAPAWGNYLYQNVLPNLSTEWLINANIAASTNNNATAQVNGASAAELFSGNTWGGAMVNSAPTTTQQMPMAGQPGPSNYYLNYYGGSIAPSLLAPSSTGTPTSGISPSLDLVDKLVETPSPMASAGASPPAGLRHHHNHNGGVGPMRTRKLSIESDADGEVDPDAETRSQHSNHSGHDSMHEHDHDHDEGVERDGMIWGMKVDDYRALSARERKRVRNRISARTFRAKRKEHLSSLESTLGSKDLEIRLAHEENARLRREVEALKHRLAKYEKKP